MAKRVSIPALGIECPQVWASLTEQLKEFVESAGFCDVILGLSGGIDSALVATLAVDALGFEHVHGLLMPSPFSTEGSVTDARALAVNLCIEARLIAIEPLYQAYLDALAPHFGNLPRDVTEENIQARIRGNLLMAFSNKLGYFVLSTGNKSESYAGYATLYGDMVGGFAPLAGLYKTHVYELARWVNDSSDVEVIPRSTIDKAPSAELSFNQKDSDSLPEYDVLDAIYYFVLDKSEDPDALLAQGIDRADVENALSRYQKSAFKRKLAAPSAHLDIYQK